MSDEKMLIKFRNKTYDITNFVHKHPGGINTLKGLNNSSIDSRFYKAPPHSDAAMYLMNEYKVQSLDSVGHVMTESNGHTSNGIENGIHKNGHHKNGIHKNGIHKNGIHKINKDTINETVNKSNGLHSANDFEIKTDESMEYLVDWSKAMIPQIGKLGDKYTEWVNKPVDRPLRLFGPSWLENLTKVPWWVVPTFWIPAISFIVFKGINEADDSITIPIILIKLVIGIFLWTLVEYSIHRWVFHLDPTNVHLYVRAFHFMIHGQHHKVPFDPLRLVFPPVPAVIIASIFNVPIVYLFNDPKIILAGGLIGYLCYDLIHYYIHYGSPSGGHLYHMKRYHYQHHFVHHDQGFGISCTIWDIIFGTKIILRKLKFLLKWR